LVSILFALEQIHLNEVTSINYHNAITTTLADNMTIFLLLVKALEHLAKLFCKIIFLLKLIAFVGIWVNIKFAIMHSKSHNLLDNTNLLDSIILRHSIHHSMDHSIGLNIINLI
jgi:hypothetical protein